jgi:hypothetical protein
MITIAKKTRRGCFAIALLAIGCGGRLTNSEPGGDTDNSDNGTKPTDTPAPACGEICRRAVDICFPGGAIDQCARDCETTRTEYKGCDGLDTFLKCQLKVPVLCSTNKVTFDGCYEEINHVVRCHS